MGNEYRLIYPPRIWEIASTDTAPAIEINHAGTAAAFAAGADPLTELVELRANAGILNFRESTGVRGIGLTLTAAGDQTIASSAGNLIAEAAGTGDVILRVNATNVVTVDGGTSRVGIGIALPLTSLHVLASAAGTPAPNAGTLLTVEAAANTYISILTDADRQVGFLFGVPGNAIRGQLTYDQGVNRWVIVGNGIVRVLFDLNVCEFGEAVTIRTILGAALTLNAQGVAELALQSGSVSRIRMDNTGLAFFAVAPIAQQASAANLTNNVAVGGVDDTIANYTDLATYSTDAAAIRNDIYQLSRKLKQVNDALRLYGLLT